jgi:hypothetical protein
MRGVLARRNRRGVDVRQAKSFAETMSKHGEANEARTRTPFESALLSGHAQRRKKRDELLSEFGSSSIELASIANVYVSEADMTGRPSPSQDGPAIHAQHGLADPSFLTQSFAVAIYDNYHAQGSAE